MNNPSGAEQFRQLSADDQARHIAINRQMVGFARDHAVPIIFAPPLSIGGKINGASGCVVRLGADALLLTASHVLSAYEERAQGGERLNWQVGNLPPVDPIPRIVWRDREQDIVLLRITENEAQSIGPCIISAPAKWPPVSPQEGQLVLIGGYPKALREENPSSGWIGAGPYSALFKVTSVGKGYCKCVVERRDLISFDGKPLPEPGTDMGGISGGPVLLVDTLNYPLVGVVTDRCEMTFAEFEIIQFATLEGLTI
jgi:Trypsin-like peptidase domain